MGDNRDFELAKSVYNFTDIPKFIYGIDYMINDIVKYNGMHYISLKNYNNEIPGDSIHWDKLA